MYCADFNNNVINLTSDFRVYVTHYMYMYKNTKSIFSFNTKIQLTKKFCLNHFVLDCN